MGLFAGMTALYYLLLVLTANFPVLITKREKELPAFLLIMALMPMTYATIVSAKYSSGFLNPLSLYIIVDVR